MVEGHMRRSLARATGINAIPASGVIIVATGLVLVLGSGCGHPATREECVAIFNKTAELQLRQQNIQDPRLIELRTRELMDVKGEELIDKCVGRTLTKSALDCVERADTEAAVLKCLY